MLVAARNSKLEESIKLHQYIREADDVISWLEEKQSLAGSDDYGIDYDHLLVRERGEDGTKMKQWRREKRESFLKSQESDVLMLFVVQVLQKKLDEFKRDVNASNDRYSSVNKLARQLVAEGHSDTVIIKEKQDQMRYGYTHKNDDRLFTLHAAERDGPLYKMHSKVVQRN